MTRVVIEVIGESLVSKLILHNNRQRSDALALRLRLRYNCTCGRSFFPNKQDRHRIIKQGQALFQQ